MTNIQPSKQDESEEHEKMVQRSISIEMSLWNDARRKVGLGSLSEVIRKFLRLWLQGKINLDDYDD